MSCAGSSSGPTPPDKRSHAAKKAVEKEYLLIDGYNIVFAWEELREMALRDIMAARDKLIDMLVDFAGFRKEHVILVFDAYKVRGGRGEVIRVGGIDVIYTKEAETADLYIEKAAHELSKKYKVTVATSDAVEQVIIYGAGAYRMSAQNLLEELRVAYLLHRLNSSDKAPSGYDVLKMATMGSARLLGRDQEIGSLEEGKCADLFLVSSSRLELVGALFDPKSVLGTVGLKGAVDYTIVNGEVTVENGRLAKVDEEKLTAQANAQDRIYLGR